jgi:hypothetical protein
MYLGSGGSPLFTNEIYFYSLIINVSDIFEQHANNILVVEYIYFMSRLLSDSFLVFVIFCY